MPEMILPKDAQLGDTGGCPVGGAYSDATIVKIEDGFLHLFRPYVQLADFTMGRRVIHYIGFENFVVSVDSPNKMELKKRVTLQ